jgi:hypothetical protein
MKKFIQTMNMEAIYEKCMADYKEKGDDNTISTTGVPFIKIGTFSIYSVNVRYFKLFNQSPQWGYSLQSGGSMSSNSGFNTLPETINACIACAEQKEKEFNEKYPELARK